ncbi:putative regulatory protein (CxxC_CxxC_SSSS) [delta proteobacterium NaphS2]|nr:putative regulatory protein (CxxC_CxxC_SSSS) [delta proteobacterium NaphS2]
MPIYEYEPTNIKNSCNKCRYGFEYIQKVSDEPLAECPNCGGKVKKIISWCRAAVIETSEEHAQINRKIAAYEKEGMWSHAAELADTHAEKIKDHRLKMRAIDDYEKAGYDAGTLEKHAKTDNRKTEA